MQNLLKNKLFIILLIAIFFILVTYSSSFAETENSITYFSKNLNKDLTIVLPDLSNFSYYSLHYNDNYYTLLFSNSPFTISQGDIFVFNASESEPIYSISYNIYYFNGDLIDFSSIPISNYSTSQSSVGDAKKLNCYIYKIYTYSSNCNSGLSNNVSALDINIEYSNSDILYNSNVVFQGAPQAQGEAVQVELMKPTQVQEIPQQIVAVVMIVLPIFLGIFGVLLVLYLIKSKNLLQL